MLLTGFNCIIFTKNNSFILILAHVDRHSFDYNSRPARYLGARLILKIVVDIKANFPY